MTTMMGDLVITLSLYMVIDLFISNLIFIGTFHPKPQVLIPRPNLLLRIEFEGVFNIVTFNLHGCPNNLNCVCLSTCIA